MTPRLTPTPTAPMCRAARPVHRVARAGPLVRGTASVDRRRRERRVHAVTTAVSLGFTAPGGSGAVEFGGEVDLESAFLF